MPGEVPQTRLAHYVFCVLMALGRTKLRRRLTIVIVIGLIAFTLSQIYDKHKSRQELVQAAHENVAQQLKAPASAHFNDTIVDIFESNKNMAMVDGTVDSQNSFGALLRAEFGCTMEREYGRWKAVIPCHIEAKE